MVCSLSGQWEGQAPDCEMGSCNNLDFLAHGSVSVTGTSLGDTATFECSHNYTLSTGGQVYRATCEADGWTAIPTCDFNWSKRREIELVGAKPGLQILVKIPDDVYNLGPDSLRFSTDPYGEEFDIKYYIDNWHDKTLWVKLNENWDNQSDRIYMFYDNPSAQIDDPSVITFEQMFPNRLELVGSTTRSLSGTKNYDYVRLSDFSSITLKQGELLEIKAQKMIIDSMYAQITGTGKGYRSGDPGNPGNGQTGSFSSGGGGGYGGKGGFGGLGSVSYALGGRGGLTYGLPYENNIDMGSSGGESFEDTQGTAGSGGGAVIIQAQEIIISGRITMNGENAGEATYDGSGGGSGGGILIIGNHVTLTHESLLSVKGGNGAPPTNDGSSGSYIGDYCRVM